MIDATAPVRVVSLASGSSGNALLIDTGQTRLVIDAGISARRIQQGLARLGLSVAHLDGILITHEHSDHITGLSVLARRGTPVTMTPGTTRAIAGAARLSLHPIQSGGTIDIGQARVTALPVSHDANEPCGYVIEANDQTIAVFTDLGRREPHLHEALRRADLIVLEANHDLDMLWSGRYPWPLKQRVAGNAGHLCNDDCGILLAEAIDDTRPRTVWLAHLSQDNNNEATARATVAMRTAGRALDVHVLPRHTPGPVWQTPSVARLSARP